MALSLSQVDFSYAPEPLPPQVPHFFTFSSAEALGGIIRRPYHLFLEIGTRSTVDAELRRLQADTPGFALSMTAANAYHGNIAGTVALALNDRFGLQDKQKLQVRTCLQEALVNAIVHGSLGLHNRPELRSNLGAYYAAVESLLACEPYRSRRVRMTARSPGSHLTLSVGDDGAGFALPSEAPDPSQPHGRGLMLIRSLASDMWLGSDGRTLHMTFAY